ncbi:UNVERIFIED_CONTAM: putative late blight resistance proteinR1B-8 [Sesamum radiatum]|uniref:Late blight resistance proteinR1B-8 n=1 Tax=Sesamum radiatum TaxID=300843 RepID=A0AAW2WHK9_SESRA
MAVAAYASLVSLSDVLDNVQHPARRHRLHLDEEQIQSLQQKVLFLEHFLELHDSQRINPEMEDLARQLVVVVDEADDIIDFHVVNQLLERSQDKTRHMAVLSSFRQDIDKIIKKIDSITEKLMVVKEEWVDVQEQLPIVSVSVGSTTLPSSDKNTMVGFDELLLQVVDELTRDESNLQIFPIVGMGGICLFMDDVWSIKAWEDFMLYLPNNGNGSRILVTTRLLDVARHVGSHNHCFEMNFLDEDQSWNLLCEKVFAQKNCPYPELEEFGRNIARCCRGLPLSIVVIGGLLAKSNNTREYWEFVSENVTSFVNSIDDDYCLKILSLSYESLPIHLKPCFLYMSVFSEDDEIRASELIKLWIIEGFLKPVRGKSLEEVAKEYLKDLADRNLILIRKWTDTGRIKICSIHDTLRELCFRESEREHLIRVPKAQTIHVSVGRKDGLCFLCGHWVNTLNKIHLQEVVGLQSTTVASPSVCEACSNMYQNLNKLRWVQDESHVKFPLHTKLRYLSLDGFDWSKRNQKLIVPGPIFLLWNLQTLVLRHYNVTLLPEISEMPKLRHLNIDGSLVDVLEGTILENLSTLVVERFSCSKVVKRIPNLKKLHVGWRFSGDYSLAQLNKLESLSLHYVSWDLDLEDIGFPNSLKKLSLHTCHFPWEKMTIIGSSLSNLEVLKLKDAFRGKEWSPIEGEFLQLKVLVIQHHGLEQWRAEDIHFPKLHGLYLEFMTKLEEIPLSIGDINTLQSIHLDKCSESAMNSAVELLKDQKEKGNESLQVYVDKIQVSVASL